jgi:ubiquitin-conjugating enzyme E2 D/E
MKNTIEKLHFILQKSDSGDSGNEEPEGAADFYMKKTNQAKAILPSLPKTDKMAERLAALTTAREYEKEKIADGLVDSLPPEGNLIIQFSKSLQNFQLHACSSQTWCSQN